MRKNKSNNLKRGMAVMLLVCLLFTFGKVNSSTDNQYGVMPCGETIETEITESK